MFSNPAAWIQQADKATLEKAFDFASRLLKKFGLVILSTQRQVNIEDYGNGLPCFP